MNVHRLLWGTALVFSVALMGCDEKTSLQESCGSGCEVVLVGDKDSLLFNLFTAPVNGLPQAEPVFDVIVSDKDTLTGDEKFFSNIVILKTDKRCDTTELSSRQNVYAQRQVIVTITSPSEKKLKDFMERQGGRLRNYLLKMNLRRIQNELKKHSNKEAEIKIKQMFGIDICVPRDMTASKVGKNFLWLSNNSPSSMQCMCFYTIATSDFQQQRDSVMQKNIQGEYEGMYMKTANITEIVKNKGKSVTVRGLWEMKNDAMGGPFIAYWKQGKDKNIVSEAFVFAPGLKKRNLLRRLEAALYTRTK